MNPTPTHGKVVILDRDGTIIIDRGYLKEDANIEFLPGAAQGLRWFYGHGYRLVVISNQSGVGRGLFSLDQLDVVHQRFHKMINALGVRLEQVYYCPHAPEADCDCRKPRPGLLLRAASELRFNPSDAIVIGDKSTDIELGRRVGAVTILIAPRLSRVGEPTPDFVVADLAEAAGTIEQCQSGQHSTVRG